jgi:predicted enzyme related to lactoylglutathione lyase
MLNYNSCLIFSETPDKLAEFYGKVFETKPVWEEQGYTSYQVGSGMVTIGPHDKVKGKNLNPERIMINFETADPVKVSERIKKLGATVIAEPYHPGESPDMWIATFADPDGNYFQLGSPMKM